LLIVYVSVFALSCKKEFAGDAKQQLPPETYMVVDKITRSGDQRLTTTVDAHWWGISQTGIIKGYEYSIDNQLTWTFTAKQSGTFLLTIPFGADTADVAVYVRAVDNLGQHDPTPASTLYPVRNSAPYISIDNSNGHKSSSFPAFRYYWIANDTDGVADIQGIEVAFNDTAKIYSLPANTTAASFAARINSGVISNSFFVYPNSKTIPNTDMLGGIKFDSLNYFYVRAFDRSGARSKWAKDSIFIRKPQSDIVLINDYTGSKNYYQSFYAGRLNAMGVPYSLYDSITTPKDDLPNDNFTIQRTFDYFKKVIWFSNDANATLSNASQNTSNFFYNGGRMLLVIDIGGSYTYTESQVTFTPISSFVSPPNSSDQFKMNPGDTLKALQTGWPDMYTGGNIFSVSFRPYFLQGQSGSYLYDGLYNGNLVIPASPNPIPWTGQSLLISRRRNIVDGSTNLIFSAMPLELLQGSPNNIDSVFRRIVRDELKF